MRKKVDERIRTLIENGVKARHRSMFVIIGDKPQDQIMNLHHILSKSVVKARPNLLWCYKKNLDFSSNQKKRAKQIKKLTQRGLLDPERADRFSLFLQSTTITYCYYRDSERILGNTFGMCILQDFEALTPNLLARTIETVEGGGLIILLLRSLSSLTSMYTMVMDVHERFRTESHSLASGRFNERFMLSLASCKSCIVMDDELNILPISSHMRAITPAPVREDAEGISESERELKNLKEELNGVFPGGPLIRKCFTMGQGEAVITFLDAISAKNPQSIVALLASRGRGKSAALGLAIAGAVAVGYSNIFVTAPSPENLKTVFEFVRKGLDMLDYKVILDYDVVESTNPDFNKTAVQINVFKHHKQIIQYIQPHEHGKLLQAQLLVIDEAAAIPLSIVKSLLGPYVVFLSSTVNGYEGTGRSLSLKLLQQLEEKNQTPSKRTMNSVSDRLFKKIELSESIRYASADPIESWLNSLLCLDVTNSAPSISRLPDASECNLYYINKDTLFSYNRDSELFLKRMMALFVASHYKNSPNDLQLIADAPAHHLFVLLGPVDESKHHLPDILCVIQICFEGQISRKSAMKSLAGGHQPCGNQIAWKFCEQFRDTVFPSLSGARIVRIATHPSAMRHGYGSAAVKILSRYFEGQLFPTSEFDFEEIPENSQVSVAESVIAAAEKACLLDENIKPRTDLPPLLAPLRERQPEKLHYLGVSFGLTLDLFRFWRKIDFVPFYIGHIPSKVTGEHTCMVLKPLNNDNIESSESDRFGFLSPFYQEFRNRFRENLAQDFNQMEYKLSMCILEPKLKFSGIDPTLLNPSESLNFLRGTQSLSMELLAAYTNNLVDYHMIKHLVRPLARAYFCEKIPVTLSHSQASVLLCMGLQLKKVPDIEEEMNLQRQKILSLYMEVMKEFYKYLRIIATNETHSTVSCLKDVSTETHPVSVDGDLHNAAKQDKDKMQANSDGFIRTCRSQQQKNQKVDQKNEKKRSEYGSDSKTNKRRRP